MQLIRDVLITASPILLVVGLWVFFSGANSVNEPGDITGGSDQEL